MVEQSGESFLLPFPCCLPHTVQSLGHALPALCRTHVRLNDVLLSLRPSLPSFRGSLRFSVRLVHWYYGTVRLLWYVHVRCLVYGLCGPVLFFRTRRTRDLPVLVHVVSQRARVLRLRRTEQPLANSVAAVLPSSISERSRHPDPSAFRSSNSPAHWYLWSTLHETPHGAPCKTRGQDGVAVLLSCRALSSPTTCRFIPAHSGLPTLQVEGQDGDDFTLGSQCNCPLLETEQQFQWVSNWTKIHKNHQIRWGADFRHAQNL